MSFWSYVCRASLSRWTDKLIFGRCVWQFLDGEALHDGGGRRCAAIFPECRQMEKSLLPLFSVNNDVLVRRAAENNKGPLNGFQAISGDGGTIAGGERQPRREKSVEDEHDKSYYFTLPTRTFKSPMFLFSGAVFLFLGVLMMFKGLHAEREAISLLLLPIGFILGFIGAFISIGWLLNVVQ